MATQTTIEGDDMPQIRVAKGFLSNREYNRLSADAKLAFFELAAIGGASKLDDFFFETQRDSFPIEELRNARFVDNDESSVWIITEMVVNDNSTARVKKFRKAQKLNKIEEAEVKQEAPVVPETTAVSEEDAVVSAPATKASVQALQMPWDGIKDLYNEIVAVHGAPKAKVINDSMKSKMKARVRDIMEYHGQDAKNLTPADVLAAFKWLFELVASCDFLVGKAGSRPFFAGLNWIIGSENYTKIVIDQAYKNR